MGKIVKYMHFKFPFLPDNYSFSELPDSAEAGEIFDFHLTFFLKSLKQILSESQLLKNMT